MSEPHPFSCSVCHAPFQGERTCTHCGADLSKVMTTIGRAFYLRCQARKALGLGQYQIARQYAQQAQRLHRTSRGQSLLYTASIAQAVRIDPHL